MKRETFDKLLDLVRDKLERQNTRFRSCIPAEKVLAIALHRLENGISYVTLALLLNVGKSTAIEATQDVVEALNELRKDHIHFSETEDETAESIAIFREFSKLPNIVEAIDGTRVRIIAPKKDAPDYFSRYQNHDFQIQAVVDGRKLFLDFEAGYPGSMHDSRVLRNWSLYAKAERRERLAEPVKQMLAL